MFRRVPTEFRRGIAQTLQRALPLAVVFLLIEFFDELSYGIGGAALPAIRSELGLSYLQVGMVLGLPSVIGGLVEPILLLLGDTRHRQLLIIGGGLLVTCTLAMIASAQGFPTLLVAIAINYPASGAFVTLSQATLMDLNRGREPQTLARWTLAGSLGAALGPLLLAAALGLALSWRGVYVVLAAFGLTLTLSSLWQRFPPHADAQTPSLHPKGPLKGLWHAVQNVKLLRWVVLLQFSDLMLDVFTSYLALYFTDVVGVPPSQASLAIGLVTFTGLIADLTLIPLLERVDGRRVVRISAIAAAGLYTTWLLVPWVTAKFALLPLIGLARLGWYSVLQGEAYAALPGRSGAVTALTSLAGSLGGILAWTVARAADRFGLGTAMWFLLLGPMTLIGWLPRRSG